MWEANRGHTMVHQKLGQEGLGLLCSVLGPMSKVKVSGIPKLWNDWPSRLTGSTSSCEDLQPVAESVHDQTEVMATD